MIYVVRHGQTELNSKKVLQGRSDYPLNEVGEAQAREAAKRLSERNIFFDRVYSSPLVRARRTAEIIAPGLPVIVDERLIEMDYGPYEGMGLDSLTPEVLTFFSDFIHNPAPRGMEPLERVVERTGRFIEDIRSAGGKDILISTHAIAMKGILEYLTPESKGGYWSKYIGNCEVYVIGRDRGSFGDPRPLFDT